MVGGRVHRFQQCPATRPGRQDGAAQASTACAWLAAGRGRDHLDPDYRVEPAPARRRGATRPLSSAWRQHLAQIAAARPGPRRLRGADRLRRARRAPAPRTGHAAADAGLAVRASALRRRAERGRSGGQFRTAVRRWRPRRAQPRACRPRSALEPATTSRQ